MSEYGRTVTARRDRPCDEGRHHCAGDATIHAGTEYARFVAFPGDDDAGMGEATRPWVLSICEPCATRYSRPMPPRKTPRRTHET